MTEVLSFGALLKQLRKRAGMTQRDLATALNYSDSLISSLEKAQRQPDVHVVITHFIPALGLQHDPATAAQLIERAAAARGEPLPGSLTIYHTGKSIGAEQGTHSTALPMPPDELIGRDEEVHRLCNRLRGHGGRLLTLVGPPGIGKTRLALAVAARMQRHYPDGALFVPLAAITDPVTMASTIVVALGGSEASAKPPRVQLIELLRRKQVLLVLDNCEQIVGAAPLIADVLAACPGLVILATSRERLHLRAEQRYRVPPLELAAAVNLFDQRAAAVDADFAITEVNRPTIEAICQRLDRLPLALELCAAQVDLLTPTHILTQLQAHPLNLLVDGACDLPPQHRTLRHAIQRSYDLLADDERTLFRCLGVFVGGCDLEALEAVSAWHERAHARSLLSTLHTLIGKSLVHAETLPTGERRFLVLETIREYALDCLKVTGKTEMVRQRHAAYYLTITELAEPELIESRQLIWFNRLEHDHDNLRGVLRWSIEQGDVETAARLSSALWRFWLVRGHMTEGRRWIEEVLSLGTAHEQLSTPIRAKVLYVAGDLAHHQSDDVLAGVLLGQSLTLWRESGEKHGIAWTLNSLGWLAMDQGEYDRARTLLEESLTLAREVAYRRLYTAGVTNVGWVSLYQRDYEQAAMCFKKSLALSRNVSDQQGIAISLVNLGILALYQNDYETAAELCEESLTIYGKVGDKEGSAECLEAFAAAVGAQGQLVRSVHLSAAAAALRNLIGVPLRHADRFLYEHMLNTVHAQLGEEAFALAWEEGHALTVEQAIVEALQDYSGVQHD